MAHDPEVVALLQRAQRACADIATVRDDLAITRAETRRLLREAHQEQHAACETAAAALPMITDDDPYALAMDVLRIMRELLSGFSAEWQVHIVKAITARTMLMVAAQLQNTPITPTA